MSWRSIRGKIIAATPFLCLIAYLIVGYTKHIWHPTWVIFFLPFLMPFILSKSLLMMAYPLACTGIYLLLGFWKHWWHPTWIIFLTIPVFYIFFGHLFRERYEDYYIFDDDDFD